MLNILNKISLKNIWAFLKTNYQLVVLLLIIALLLVNNCGLKQKTIKLEQELNEIQLVELPEDYNLIKNEILSLKEEKKILKEELEYFKNRKQDVKFIVKEKIKLVGQETIFSTIPGEFVFKVNNEIPVAKFEVKNNEYIYKSYDLDIKTTTLISDKDTITKTTITSSADNIERPVTTKQTYVYQNTKEKAKIINPKLNIGVSVASDLTYGAIVGLSILEIKKFNINLLEPNLILSDSKVRLGVTPINYNLGAHIPIIENFWIGVGYETNFINHFGNLSLKGRL